MRHGHVIALVINVAHALPVDRDVVAPEVPVADQLSEPVGGELFLVPRHDLGYRGLRAGLETDEYESVPQLHFDRDEAVFDRIKLRQTAR